MVAQCYAETLDLTQAPEVAQPYDDTSHNNESLMKRSDS